MTINNGFSPGRHALMLLGSFAAISPGTYAGFSTSIIHD